MAKRETSDRLKVSLKKNFLSLSKTFEFNSINLDKTVIDLLNSSKHDLHNYLLDTYGSPYEMTSDSLFDLFNHLTLYYTSSQPSNLLYTFLNFFEKLSKKLLVLILHDFDLTEVQTTCLHNYTIKNKFFGNIPHNLGLQIKRSFLLLRTFSTSLQVGSDLLSTPIQQMVSSQLEGCDKCIDYLTNCSSCSITTSPSSTSKSPLPTTTSFHPHSHLEFTKPSHPSIFRPSCCTPNRVLFFHKHLQPFNTLQTQWQNFIGVLERVAGCYLEECHLSRTVRLIDKQLSKAMTRYADDISLHLNQMIKTCKLPVNNHHYHHHQLSKRSLPSAKSSHPSSHSFHLPWSTNEFADKLNDIRVDVRSSTNLLSSLITTICHKIIHPSASNVLSFSPFPSSSSSSSALNDDGGREEKDCSLKLLPEPPRLASEPLQKYYAETPPPLNTTMLQRTLDILTNVTNKLNKYLNVIKSHKSFKNEGTNKTITAIFQAESSSGFYDGDDDEDYDDDEDRYDDDDEYDDNERKQYHYDDDNEDENDYKINSRRDDYDDDDYDDDSPYNDDDDEEEAYYIDENYDIQDYPDDFYSVDNDATQSSHLKVDVFASPSTPSSSSSLSSSPLSLMLSLSLLSSLLSSPMSLLSSALSLLLSPLSFISLLVSPLLSSPLSLLSFPLSLLSLISSSLSNLLSPPRFLSCYVNT